MENRAEGFHTHLTTGVVHGWACMYRVDDARGEIDYTAFIQRLNGAGTPVKERRVQRFRSATQAPEDALVESINVLIDSIDFAKV